MNIYKMIVIILCGGRERELEDYSYPKPLNMINGKPSISYCLHNLPESVKTLHFIAAPHLAKYNFEEIVKNIFKTRECIVHWIPYFTRGPIETAWLGTFDFANNDDSVVFLDNDIIHNFPQGLFENKSTAFIGYATDTTGSEEYSFLTVGDGGVVNIKEKKRISDKICCGVYGFKNIRQFLNVAIRILTNHNDSELYMSKIFKQFIDDKEPIIGVPFNSEVIHIGTLKDLHSSWNKIEKTPMRVCFDLDNTLVTYPVVPGDYRTVKPITYMIELARKMKSEGHTIIIHTARRMTTHNNNVGATIKDIGTITFQTLADFDIPFDELLFGKPIADMYIDDRGVNPYYNSVECMGYLHPEVETPLNMLQPNKYNKVSIVDNKVKKTGPSRFLRGEIYFYEKIPQNSTIATYFPKFYGSLKQEEVSHLFIEHIKGIPFYTLFKHELITELNILQLFEFMDTLHAIPGPIPTDKDIYANYIDKLQARFAIKEDYPFSDASEFQSLCIQNLSTYKPSGVAYIHGDLWFSNIIIDFNNSLKLFDMKGQINEVLTTGGDRLYDYGKIYQSLLGYDAALYGDTIDECYKNKMISFFLRETSKRGISLSDLKYVTISLVIGTLHSIKDYNKKHYIWNFIKSLF